MTILQALAARYDRLAETGNAPVLGFAPAKISFEIVLDLDGNIISVNDIRSGNNKKLPKEILAPQAPSDRRGKKIVAGLFWDTSDYALGIWKLDPSSSEVAKAKLIRKAAEKHAAFKERHKKLLASIDEPECNALKKFLEKWNPPVPGSNFSGTDIVAGSNVTFRLDSIRGYIFQNSSARRAMELEAAAAQSTLGPCLVTGEILPIARLHPPIKNIGDKLAPLVSFNEDAFISYGKTQGFNAPVSEAVAFAYATALNALIAGTLGVNPKGKPIYSNRIALGEDTVVFWAETEPAEALTRGLLDPRPPNEKTETDAVRTKLRMLEEGRPLEQAAPDVKPSTRVYILGLSPNAARLSVRFWLDQSLGDLARHIQEHWRDLALLPAPRGGKPALWALLYEIAPLRKIDKGIQHLAGEMTRAILSGGHYPASLLTQALMRVRAEKEKTPPNRVALIKAVLARQARKADPQWKDNLVALDRDEPNIGYRLGRLFAVLEAAQYAGIGAVNASIKDKFFGAASATPGHIFPLLLRGTQDHLSTARKKGKGGRAFRLDGEISQILGGVDAKNSFPATLTREDQGRFVVGFYHQDAELRIPRVKNETPDMPTEETVAEDREDEQP